tara:strand:- start:343 stop:1497 length:1155 start_codon:yes stop_codon:yes gene_type:complete
MSELKKILIAPDGFKESLKAIEVAKSMEIGVKKVWPKIETKLLPVADGGDGTMETIIGQSNGKIYNSMVTDPLGRKIVAEWGGIESKNIAVIEIAKSSGLSLLTEEERNPLITSTRGAGQLIKEALDLGYKEIIIGVGGSATNDGGIGMLSELGVKFYNSEKKEIGDGGNALIDLEYIDTSKLDNRIKNTSIIVACDVSNPLCGPKGASAIFGPQKGATPQMVSKLDKALMNYAKIIKKDLGIDIINYPGSGASGGLGAAFMAFFGARLRLGADIVLDLLDIDTQLKDSNLVIVGEGQFDRSTIFNKAPISVAHRAKSIGIPVLGIAGSLGAGFNEIHNHGIDSMFSLVNRPMSMNDAVSNSKRLIEIATEQACRAINMGLKYR